MDNNKAKNDVYEIRCKVHKAQENLFGMLAGQNLEDKYWCMSNLVSSLDRINDLAIDLLALINAENQNA